MKDIFWNIFEKSGNIDAFMAHKEFERSYADTEEKKTECDRQGMSLRYW